MQKQSLTDTILIEFDALLRTLCPVEPRASQRPNPAAGIKEALPATLEKKNIGPLMRVNHSGEVCAQALYRGQALGARNTEIKQAMTQSAEEEIDHLAWCEERLQELNCPVSRLNFFWYTGSFFIGFIASLVGDKVSLGFVAETEHQVAIHLQKHLEKISTQDKKTHAILQKMHDDELQHAALALETGGVVLPKLIQKGMQATSKVMTTLSYYF